MPTITIGNRKLFYSYNAAESGSGPNVVLVHGAGGRNIDWPGKMRSMPHASVYALDLPGHAKSDGPGCDTVEGYADVVMAFIDGLKLEGVVVIGHSLGGAIAQTLALHHSPKIIGLVLIGTGAKMPVSPAILEGILPEFRKTVAMISKFCWSKQARMEHVFLSRRLMLETPPEVLLGDFTACATFNLTDQINAIAVPTLVVGGEFDKMTRMKSSQFLADTIPNAQLVKVDAGHFMMQEKPDEVAQAADAFCAQF